MALLSRSVWLCVLCLTLIGCSGEKHAASPPLPPMSLERLYQQGREAYNAGRYDEAATHFARVVEAEPQYWKAWNNWGVALSRGGKGWEAIAKFQHVLQHDPHNAEAQYNWGATLARLNRHQEAVEHFEEAIAMKPIAEFLSAELQAKLQDYLQRQRERAQDSDAIQVPGVPPGYSPRTSPGPGR